MLDTEALGLQRPGLRATDLETVQALEERALAGRHRVHEARVLGGGCGDVHGVAHHPLGEVAVAAVSLGQRADVRGRVVADLAAEDLVLAAAERDRRRGPDVRLRRHRRYVGRLCDEQTRRRGAGTVG